MSVSSYSANRSGAREARSPRQNAAERARAATRARLIAAGKALFAEQGLHRITTHDIAAHAGVAAGTYYNHFRDKAALFSVIADEAIAELIERLDGAVGPEESLRAGVRPIAEALLSFAEDRRDLIRILFSREADAAAIEADVLDRLAARIAEGRSRSIARGEMPSGIDPTVLSQALVGMWARVVAWWAEDPSRAPRDRVIDTLVQIQLSGTHPAAS
ncbi:MAG: TetR/AcrR family transcriptional regulator [Deltaproteobacteria bacterium]|nr:TetR/AcrR family transcriptional regulator [Deltaproteobacteria bacterium]MBW2383196.1 TetR/AcrR family transcriptional regulator [Deltaproteobacteria bacterium]MBW2695571.1 TetR/AcrR family transcriptional regulator [Deltaproteobacteria bacterium]